MGDDDRRFGVRQPRKTAERLNPRCSEAATRRMPSVSFTSTRVRGCARRFDQIDRPRRRASSAWGQHDTLDDPVRVELERQEPSDIDQLWQRLPASSAAMVRDKAGAEGRQPSPRRARGHSCSRLDRPILRAAVHEPTLCHCNATSPRSMKNIERWTTDCYHLYPGVAKPIPTGSALRRHYRRLCLAVGDSEVPSPFSRSQARVYAAALADRGRAAVLRNRVEPSGEASTRSASIPNRCAAQSEINLVRLRRPGWSLGDRAQQWERIAKSYPTSAAAP